MKASTLVSYTRQRVLDVCDEVGGKREAAARIAACVDGLNPEWVYRFAIGIYDNPRADSLDLVISALDSYGTAKRAA